MLQETIQILTAAQSNLLKETIDKLYIFAFTRTKLRRFKCLSLTLYIDFNCLLSLHSKWPPAFEDNVGGGTKESCKCNVDCHGATELEWQQRLPIRWE